MGKKIYREEQSLHILGLKFLMLFWTGLFIIKIFRAEWQRDLWQLLIFLGIILLGWTILYLVKLKININRKRIAIRISPFNLLKKKLYWSDIESLEFFNVPESLLWNGYTIHFGRFTSYNLGDHRGLKITTKNGDTYLIFSENLYQNKQTIAQLMDKLQLKYADLNFKLDS